MKITIHPPIEIDIDEDKCGTDCDWLDKCTTDFIACGNFGEVLGVCIGGYARCQACLDAEKEEE